jgi:hypothetical protein
VQHVNQNRSFEVEQTLSPRQIEVLRAGGLINWVRARLKPQPAAIKHEKKRDKKHERSRHEIRK